MAKQPANHGKRWSPADQAKLQQLARKNTPTRVIGIELARTAEAVQVEAAELNVSLKPVNQSPYNRRPS